MIPKIIHYCWFGGKKLPAKAEMCLKSWKKYLPDYELRLWNEENFNLKINSYVTEAYEAGMYAFVTDYVRLYALYKDGGIYMDTDVEVLRNLDEFLILPAFSGFESNNFIPTGIMGSEKSGIWVKEQLGYYTDRHFRTSDGDCDTTTNVHIISKSMSEGGFQFNNIRQDFNDIVTFFPSDFFCPKSYETGKIKLTSNSACIHHFTESWRPRSKRAIIKIRRFIGPKIYDFIIKLRKKAFRSGVA
jgi:hypothetical protein